MNKQINWKMFAILFAASLFSAIVVLPYALELEKGVLASSPMPLKVIIAVSIVQSAVLFAAFIFVGLNLSRKVGLGLPLVEKWLEGKALKKELAAVLRSSITLGALAGIAIVGLDFVFFHLGAPISLGQAEPPVWMGLLASFYGGIGEEIMMRLFLMTVLVWLSYKISKTADGKPTTTGIWAAIILSSVLFGLGHLPATAAITAITPLVLARALLLNGVGGVLFGWLYWKKGLESAIAAHFTADIVLHVILPLLALAG